MKRKNTGKQAFARYAVLVLGAAVLAFGLYNVHHQSRITEGGVLGMTLLLQRWLGLSPAIGEIVLDVICYGLGARYLGKAFLRDALLATGLFSAFYAVNERVGFVLPSLAASPLAAAVLGGLFVGVGVGLVVRAGGACGGDDALALVIAKAAGWKLPQAYLLTDVTVLVLSLSYIPVASVLCSLVTVTLSSFLIGRIARAGRPGRG